MIDKFLSLGSFYFCFTLFYANTAFSDPYEEYTTREYPVTGHGMLVLTVPEPWNITYYEPAEFSYPVIIFYPQEKPHAFQLTLSPLWDDGYFRNITNLSFIKDYVETIGTDLLEYSDQKSLNLIEMNGRQGNGFYFQLSDEAAPETEFKYLTEGAIAVGELLVVFSYFSNLSDDSNADVIIKMLEQAIQNHQRQVHFGN